MRDRGILFSAPMVRALLDGRKTQTRRLATSPLAMVKVGDRLWVREALNWSPEDGCIRYSADGTVLRKSLIPDGFQITRTHVPSMHMARWASRLTLTVTDVRRHPVQEISVQDALAEGVDCEWRGVPVREVESFKSLWEQLHGATAWEKNPDVVAVSFTVAHGNIDALGRAA